MTLWRKWLTLAAVWPCMAAAADLDMMNLVMPNADMVTEINLAKIMSSPIGSAMSEAVHRGVATQLTAELAKSKPELQEQIARLARIDWSRQVQDIILAGVSGKSSSALIIVRSSFEPAQVKEWMSSTADGTEYQGVRILTSEKPGNAVIAFLDNSIVLIGQMADVKAAIDRRGQHTALPEALRSRMDRYSQYDIWVASTASFNAPPANPAARTSAAGAQMEEYVKELVGFNGGVRFSPDLDLSADLEARTEQGAAKMAEGLKWLTSMAQTQARNANSRGVGLEGLKYRVSGKHFLLSLHVPEEQIRAGLRQMHTAQANRTAAAPSQIRPAAPSSGLPPPPPGTIRVQSSDMGTVLIPVGKDQ